MADRKEGEYPFQAARTCRCLVSGAYRARESGHDETVELQQNINGPLMNVPGVFWYEWFRNMTSYRKVAACLFVLAWSGWSQEQHQPGAPTARSSTRPRTSVYDSDYKSLGQACTAAGSGTLVLSQLWSNLASQTLNCDVVALDGGIVQPAAGQVVNFLKPVSGTLARHFDDSRGGKILFSVVHSLPVQWFGARCDGVTDDHDALQQAFNTLSSVDFSQTAGPCMTSETITTGADGQIVSGIGSGGLESGGVSSLKAKGNIRGPVLALLHNGVQVQNMVIDGNKGAALYGITAECANSSRILNSQIREARSDNLRVTNTDAAYLSCPAGPNNNGLIVQNSIITGSINGRGIHITGLAGDINNNLIQFNGLRVNHNYADGLCATGSQNQINGGNYSNNGANKESTQYYAIRLSCPDDVVSATDWEVNNVDPEDSNFNTETKSFRGPLIYFGKYSQNNTLNVAGSIIDFCNAPGCFFYTIGSDIWRASSPGGIQEIVGTGEPGLLNYGLFDHYYGSHPVWAIQGAGGGSITGATVVDGGSGYKTGDVVLVIQSGGNHGSVRVTSATGGTVAAVAPVVSSGALGSGFGYVSASHIATSGGSGRGLVLNITASYAGRHLPISWPLANPLGGIVTTDANGQLDQVANTQATVCPVQTVSFTVPRGCVHVPIDASHASGGLTVKLDGAPLPGETHTLAIIGIRAGTDVTIDANGRNLNLSGGPVKTAGHFLTAINQTLTIRYNGNSWDIISYYH